MEELFADIARRAFHRFEQRGGAPGRELEDWFHAEQEVLSVPRAELIEKNKEFVLRPAAPGLDAKDLRVTAQPDAIVVEAGAAHSHQGTEGEIRFCEFGEKRLFRRFALPGRIDVDRVRAALSNGILQIVAAKTHVAGKSIAVSA